LENTQKLKTSFFLTALAQEGAVRFLWLHSNLPISLPVELHYPNTRTSQGSCKENQNEII